MNLHKTHKGDYSLANQHATGVSLCTVKNAVLIKHFWECGECGAIDLGGIYTRVFW